MSYLMATMRMHPNFQKPLIPLGAAVPPGLRRKAAKEEPFIFWVVRWSWIILAFCVFIQIVLFGTMPNIIAISSIILAWLLTTNVYLRPNMLGKYPLSSFLIIGFVATQFYFPLLFTTLEGKPVVFNLSLPYQVFFHSTAALVVLVVSHAIYRALARKPYSTPSSLLNKIGLFEPPAELQLWLMGFVGLAATVYVYFLSPTVGWEVSGAASDKAIQGLIYFSYAPYFIPLGRLYGSEKNPPKRLVLMLVGFTALLFMVSIGRNSRGAFMIGFTSLGFAYALGLLLGVFKTKIFTLKNLLVGLLGVGLITGPIADLGTAMVIVRDQRSKISNSELTDLTIQAFFDKRAIKARRLLDNEEQGDWDERYLDNIFTARFSNLKFNDASLVQASKISERDTGMLEYSIDYIQGALPGPIVKALKLDVDKEAVYAVSFGDYLYLEAGGPTHALGGFRTGHFAGTGMAAYGWWYLFFLGVGMIPVYMLFDILVIKTKVPATSTSPSQVPGAPTYHFSLCAMLALTSIFQFLPAESVGTTATFIIRGWIQMILLYVVIYYITRLISFITEGRKLPRRKRHVQFAGQ